MSDPPTGGPVRKHLALSADLAEAIAQWRFDARVPSEAEAYRRLLAAGLDALRRPPGGAG